MVSINLVIAVVLICVALIVIVVVTVRHRNTVHARNLAILTVGYDPHEHAAAADATERGSGGSPSVRTEAFRTGRPAHAKTKMQQRVVSRRRAKKKRIAKARGRRRAKLLGGSGGGSGGRADDDRGGEESDDDDRLPCETALAGRTKATHRERLVAFYRLHNPTKLSAVDATLERYAGREATLFVALEARYTAAAVAQAAAAARQLERDRKRIAEHERQMITADITADIDNDIEVSLEVSEEEEEEPRVSTSARAPRAAHARAALTRRLSSEVDMDEI